MLSNGHGEDAIGARLVPELRARGFTLEALPIVGDGHAYHALGVPIAGPTAAMPSGGFVYGRPAALAGDLAHGLLGLTLAQLRALHAGRWDAALAIGDVVPLGFAWHTGLPFGFVGCAKSDLYLGGRPGAYLPHERWLMRRPTCLAVWPRDAITTDNLRAAGVAADWLGNPMMDGLAPRGVALPGDPQATTFLLLPGSRGEAVANLAVLRRSALAIAASGRPARFLAAIAPGLDPTGFADAEWPLVEGLAHGWADAAEPRDGREQCALRHADGAVVWLVEGAFADAAHAARLALAMAGTATEQVVGLGKPAIAIPGKGPQFTWAFAEAQTRLLGESVLLLPDDPARVAMEAWTLLDDAERLARIAANGRARMGPPGAAARIADALVARLSATKLNKSS